MKYYLGVDGGNTKTQYLLFDDGGNFVGSLKAGSCSHEALGSFGAAKDELERAVHELCKSCGIQISDIAHAAFGLAGADFDWQKKELTNLVSAIGFGHFELDNDGILALIAGSESGKGVCCIAGTGCVCVGADEEGRFLQIGGIGPVSGDCAGGYFIALEGFKAVYNRLFRCGTETTLTERIFGLLKLADEDGFGLAAVNALRDTSVVLNVNTMVAEAAGAGDRVAAEIVKRQGREQAYSVAGMINRLKFRDTVEVILAGSVWCKADVPLMKKAFTQTLKAYARMPVTIKYLAVPPAAGAVIWAYGARGIGLRNTIIAQLKGLG